MLADIPGYEGYYKIDEHGQVFNAVRGTKKTTMHDKDGYCIVNLYKKGHLKIGKIHRLMVLCWLGAEHLASGAVVDHIDGDKRNNLICNLRVTSVEVNNNNLQGKLNKRNTSGHQNVYYNKAVGAWKVEIPEQGKLLFHGYYLDKEHAIRVAKELLEIKRKRLGL